MILLIDIGNSCIKWATLERGQLGPQKRFFYKKDDKGPNLTNLLDLSSLDITAVWVANVAGPQWANTLIDWTKECWGLMPIFVETSDYECGVKNGYKNPKQLGVDRWVAMIGAYHLEKAWLCVADCGTALTLDIISDMGVHQGGVIMPGVTTMRHALLRDTYALAKLTNGVNQVDNGNLLAYDTHSGIALGSLYAVAGGIECVIRKWERNGQAISLILTGGHAPAMVPFLSIPCRQIPDLVLQGLAVMVERVAL